MNRRQFLTAATALAASCSLASTVSAAEDAGPTAAKLPRWRGFNLLEKFLGRNAPFRETDFAWIAEFGCNFVRLPLNYQFWSDPKDWRKLKEPVLKEIDQAVEFGKQHQIHVNINFHRARLLRQSAARAVRPVERRDGAGSLCLSLGPLCRALQGHSQQPGHIRLGE